MKKLLALVLVIATSLILSACGGQKSSFIEPTAWVMSSVQSSSDGAIVYCSANEKEDYPEADVRDIICNIDGSAIEILNNDTSEEWNGTYKVVDNNEKRSIYEVTIGGEEGQMVKSLTEYDDTAPQNTLILSCGDYVLNFFEKE